MNYSYIGIPYFEHKTISNPLMTWCNDWFIIVVGKKKSAPSGNQMWQGIFLVHFIWWGLSSPG